MIEGEKHMANVLVAGATGMLGSRIAHRLLEESSVGETGQLGLLVRNEALAHPAKHRTIDALVDKGAVVVPGDLQDEAALADAVAGMEVVVSAVQGGSDVIVDGQVKLARAAERGGVRRFVPSDFAIDIFRALPGAPMFAARRRADQIIDGLDLEVFHILTGGFLDMMVAPGNRGLVNVDRSTVTCWGTGTEPFNATTVDDTARLTARLVLDATATPGVHMFAAAETSPEQIAEEISLALGRTFSLDKRGTLDELRDAISREHDEGAAIGLWYQLVLATTPTFAASENHRYPDIKLTSLREQVRKAFAETA
ncbi:NmrA family NAD(P)-binding protein [Streptomyces sp. NPDC057199]|uniref:NmrA family NAD(P)-binding protein n=1 Tax=Streptomyces sp. NPDC057199 TaxID=3346047 RepID=UPI0036286F74